MASVCTSSLDRKDEWKRCCAETMGFEWVDRFDDDDDDENVNGVESETMEDTLQVTNLLDSDADDDFEDDDQYEKDGCEKGSRLRHEQTNDAWTDSALRIQGDLNRMSQWIQSKKLEYVGLDMKDEEAGLIQSTVTSFAATTASDLETLRNMITSRSSNKDLVISNNLANHRAGIVQILLAQLQEQVTKPFAALQKQRVREAVQLWQNPLQCKLFDVPKPKLQKPDDALFDDDGDYADELPKEQRYLPERSYRDSSNFHSDGDSFISKYANKPTTTIPTSRPSFLVRLEQRQSSARTENDQSAIPSSSTRTRERMSKKPLTDVPMSSFGGNVVDVDQVFEGITTRAQGRRKAAEEYQHHLEEDLRAESVQLATTLIASNDLDSVQQMEKRMVEITTLIGQFSNLVQEQQEQVLQVHESAKETKDNIDKGQENLIDAAERTKQSKHYKAWSIFAMAAILAFFHILRS
eukprot:jgi/Psemu1/2722/gm1.2722_g